MNAANQRQARLIAFYLPQFHPIPENDAWWGKGFTEWTNVVKARPLFRGHYQPHLPADLGFYDLRVPETREAQAEMAQQYGISGFCYYHYWFHGKRLLQRPFNEVLESGRPQFPFCLCWANENWTRRWDGQHQEVLVEQSYSAADDREHIRSLLPAFGDQRYIRIGGRPLFLVYRVSNLPDPTRTAEIWREEVARAGLPQIYLGMVTSDPRLDFDPTSIGFDASVDFQPDWGQSTPRIYPRGRRPFSCAKVEAGYLNNGVHSYEALALSMMGRPEPGYKLFPGVTPAWDNSPRRKSSALIFTGSTPALYGTWLRRAIASAQKRFEGDERLVFVNAWNEWAEGNHLEPDQHWARAYLEATREALNAASSVQPGHETTWDEYSRANQWLILAAETDSGYHIDPQELATIYLQKFSEASWCTSPLSPIRVRTILSETSDALSGARVDRRARRAFAGWLLIALYYQAAQQRDHALVRWALPRLLLRQPSRALNLGVWSIAVSAAVGESHAARIRSRIRRLAGHRSASQ